MSVQPATYRMAMRALFLLSVTAMLARAPRAAAQNDMIHGRVSGADGAPIANATVSASPLPERAARRTRTDDNGIFIITFPAGTGDYLVEITALGFSPRRFELKRIGESGDFVANARLEIATQALQPVRVRGSRRRPDRGDDADVGGTGRALDLSVMSVDDYGDLSAMAGATLGVDAIPSSDGTAGGFSVFGLSPDQNATTLNGLDFGGTLLPRDAPVSVSLSTGPYDVSRGGFSGGQLVLRSRRGTNYITRLASATLDAPAVQWSDQVASAVGQQYASETASGLLSGPIAFDRAFYTLSFQLGRRSSDLRTLLNTSEAGLDAASIAADSVTRLLGILRQLGVPVGTAGVPRLQTWENGSVFGAVDIVPPTRNAGHAFNLTYAGNWNRQTPSWLLPTELPTRGTNFTNWSGTIQGRHTNYAGFGILTETSLGVNATRIYTAPLLDLPTGNVFITSELPDSTTGVQVLSFGGAPSHISRSTAQVSARNQLSWYSLNEKHLLSMTTELRRETGAQISAVSELGAFYFPSLGALAAAQPSSFTRSMAAHLQHESQWMGAIAFGDRYAPVDAVEIQYGVRVDANRFGTAPAANPAVAQMFGLRTDNAPDHVYASPRVGFAWVYGPADTIPGGGGARYAANRRASVRGGVGVFQSLPITTSIGPAMDNTGLASAVQRLTCIGSATPAPAWADYDDPAAIPASCAGGAGGVIFANKSPNVVLYDPTYRSPHSVRGNLQWTVFLPHSLAAAIEGTYSLNLDQPSAVDVNFSGVPRFTLAAEGNRPVFVQPSSIDSASGALDWHASRLSPDFSHVTSLRSIARSKSRQLSVRLQPNAMPGAFLDWSVAYVYSSVRELAPGFSSTNGNPLDVTWSRTDRDWRHQLQYTIGVNPFDVVRVSFTSTLRSGFPYTPMVAGDVNGDGYFNDRAFIFNPDATSPSVATVTSPGVVAAMRTLLESGPPEVRACLNAQLEKVASRNSCEGPWTTTSSLTMQINPVKVRLPRHATLSLQLSNPLGMLDQRLHGMSALRGWGDVAIPTPTLLYLRGFDPQTAHYVYEVNPRFGTTDRSLAAQWGPPRLTIMFSLDAGPSQEHQMLTHELDRGRKTPGDVSTAESLRLALGAQLDLPNPMAAILQDATMLALTGPQADSVATMNGSYTTFIRSVWNPVWTSLSALPPTYDDGPAYAQYHSAREASIDFLIRLAPAVMRLLTDDQRQHLAINVREALDVDYLRSIRSGTVSQGVRGMVR
jgi:hypothetical protein